MDPNVKKYINEYNVIMLKYFEKRAKKYPFDVVDRVGWSSRETQHARFDTLFKIGDLNNRSLLDVGCGVGDFYGYLLTKNISIGYTGIDLVKNNCIDASKKYNRTRFLNLGLIELNNDEKFDYVIASGIFFLKYANWNIVVKDSLIKMFSLCRIGIAVNFQSAYSEPEDDISKHVFPDEVVKMISSLTKIYKVHHDYAKKDNDFTLFLYRDYPNF